MKRSSLTTQKGLNLDKTTRAKIFKDIRKANPNSIVTAFATKIKGFFVDKPGHENILHVAYEATVMVPVDGESPTLQAITTRDSVAYVISE